MLKKLGYTVAIIDSGIGGLSVLRQLIKKGGNYIYFADNEFMPYGKRTKRQLNLRLESIINLLFDRYRVDKIIIACNTASTTLKGVYPNVITMTFDKNRTYFATNLTKKNLTGYKIIADSSLASKIEKNIFDTHYMEKVIKTTVRKHNLDELDELVLGCTHYELVKDIFQKYCPNTRVINNSEYILNNIDLKEVKHTNVYFITTKQSIKYNQMLAKLIGGK